MQLLGGQSGFKTLRDLILFAVGLGICIFHVITTNSADLSVPLLLFGAGLAGAPSVLKSDERRDKKDANE